MISRRRALLGIGISAGCIALGIPATVAAQPARTRRVGFLWGTSRAVAEDSGSARAFLDGMRALGYNEGRDFVIEARYGGGSNDRLATLAEELVRLEVDVIVTTGGVATQAARHASSTLPIVFAMVNDPIGAGFATSLAQPGGNITGLSRNSVDAVPKQLELLALAVPKLARVAVLANPGNPAHPGVVKSIGEASGKRGLTVVEVDAATVAQIRQGFARMRQERSQALVVLLDQFLLTQGREIAALALEHRLPTIYSVPDDVEGGGLMSYGLPASEFVRQAASYVDKIFKGARAGELPIQEPTRYSLLVNRGTAKALGLSLPAELLLRADRVID